MRQMGYLVATGLMAMQLVAAFYGFWLVWRVLLAILPGPADTRERIAPYAGYFTDPFVVPVSRALRLPTWVISLLELLVVAAVQVALARAGSWV